MSFCHVCRWCALIRLPCVQAAFLERNDLDLDEALRLFEEGIGHLRTAGAALKTVDARVQQLVEAADGSFSVVDLGA